MGVEVKVWMGMALSALKKHTVIARRTVERPSL